MAPSSAAKKFIYKAADCPCSALALNCCQFGCLIPDVPNFEYGFANANWMSELAKVNPDAKLRDMVIPGSHDSASSSIGKLKLFSAVGRTQNVTVAEQLSRGARYLDIRIAGVKGGAASEVIIVHGCLSGGNLVDVVPQISSFLNEHPGEFIFIELVHEFGRDFSAEQKKFALDYLKDQLGDKLYTRNDCMHLMNRTTLQQLQDQSVQVCVLLHPRMFGFQLGSTEFTDVHVAEHYGFFHSGRWMRSQWHNTKDPSSLLNWNLEEVQKYATNKSVILNNQFVLTPGVGGAMDVVKLLVGLASLRPVSFAANLYQRDVMDDFLREHADEAWNIVMMDFLDLAPALVSFMISLNFFAKMELSKLVATEGGAGTSLDVTERAKRFVCREKVLYLTNVAKDLDLPFGEGTLTIAYKIGDKNHILELEFTEATEVVISQYAQNEGTLIHVDMEAGAYYNGKIISKDDLATKRDKAGCIVFEPLDGALMFSVV
jgi:hypothetical protein